MENAWQYDKFTRGVAICAVSHVFDEQFGCCDSIGIAVIEYTKAPDTTTELCSISLLSGESHEYDFVAAVGQTGIVVIGV